MKCSTGTCSYMDCVICSSMKTADSEMTQWKDCIVSFCRYSFECKYSGDEK